MGSGTLAAIANNRIRATVAACALTNHVTLDQSDGGVFTVIGTATITGAGTFYPLFIQNTDPSYLMVIDRLFVEVVGTSGGTAIPNAGDYFSSLFLSTYTSGGTPYTPIVLNRTSTKVANGVFYVANPTLGVGSVVESHRLYPQANGTSYELIPSRLDDIVLGRSNTLAVRYTTATTSGTILSAVTFMMASIDSMA